MAQDGRVVHARVAAVRGRVGVLDIEHHQINGRAHAGKILIRAIAAGFDGGVQAVQQGDHRLDKGPLHHGFPAGKGHAAFCRQKRTGAPEPTGQRFRLHALPCDAAQSAGADGQAAPAYHTAIRVPAHSPARAAVRAGGRAHHDLRLGRQAFGVVAPAAPQRAPLQEHRGADAGSVVQGELLDIKNDARHRVNSARRRI